MRPEHTSSRILSTFLEISLRLAQQIDLTHVLSTIVERAMEVTGARYGAAATLDEDGSVSDFIHRGLSPEEVALLPHIPEGKGLLGLVISERKPVRVDSIAMHPQSVGFPTHHVPMRAFLGVPLMNLGRLVGALYLSKTPDQAPFTDGDEDLTVAIGAMAGVAIQNAKLFASETDRAERSNLLQEIASRLRRSLDISDVCTTTARLLGRAAGADRCYIRLTGPNTQDRLLGNIIYEWDAPDTSALIDHATIRLPVAERAARTRLTEWSDDVEKDEQLVEGGPDGDAQDYLAIGTRAVLATPLEYGDELIGVIGFHSMSPRKWGRSDAALIEAAAREVAVGIHHARLYQEAVETAEKLTEVDQMRSDFVSMVSHELRSPMTVVAGIADVLEKRHDRLRTEQRSELIETLGREARRLRRLVSEILDLEALDQGGMRLEKSEIDLSDIVREAVADSGERGRTRTIVEPGDVHLEADPDRIKQVLLNLISNAAKFSEGSDSIDVSLRPEARAVVVSVTDHGPGIPEEEQSHLFQKFSRLDSGSPQTPGSGLGLYLSRAIIERHGGEIWVESSGGEGSVFSFRLPR